MPTILFSFAAKEGPIYSYEWNPRGNEFCVIYGFMPAKATLFDLKCTAKFDFGTGPRNTAYYNNFGNHILLFKRKIVCLESSARFFNNVVYP